jgi:nitric oxide reductase NorE protein
MTALRDAPAPEVLGAQDLRSPDRIPGEIGLWLLILSDMLVFGVLFVLVLVTRAEHPTMFARSTATVHQGLGVVDTLLLLTASVAVALAVRSTRAGLRRPAGQLLGIAAACAVGFLGVKAFEWGSLLHAGHSPSSNDYYQLYFMLTGMHLVHVLIGTCVLLFARRRVAAGTDTPQLLEGSASYWHMVDALWLGLFPLLYLMGR